MARISTCLIVKNESNCIRRCIDSIVKFSDEIIVYDTGSDDGTQDICREYDKVKVIQGTWCNDFSVARNESFKYATNEYIMWVDADDVIDEKSQEWLLKFKDSSLTRYKCVFFQYIYDMNDDGTYTTNFLRERILRRDTNPVWYSPIHEYISFSASNEECYYADINDFNIKHFKHSPNPLRNITIYRELESNNKINCGRDWFYYAQECRWHDTPDSAIDKYLKAIECDDTWYVDKLNSLYQIAMLYFHEKNDVDLALKYAMSATIITKIPRADVCCLIGDIYELSGDKRVCKLWYELALENIPDSFEGTFMLKCYYGEYPALKLCVIEYDAGNIDKAIEYNNIALRYSPNDENAINNKIFFDNYKA